VRATGDSSFTVVPDGSWGFIVHRSGDSVAAFVTGSTTRPVRVSLRAGDEIISVSLAASAYSPERSAVSLIDKAQLLPDAGPRKVWWSPQHKIELPTIETAGDFVAALIKREQLILNKSVAAVLAGHTPYISQRTLQRHFLQTTGMTHNYWQQIQRAQRAVSALRLGKSLAEVAYESGYVDQSHMTRWLKQIVGRTPAAIASEQNSPTD
jgi:hypothetical protein